MGFSKEVESILTILSSGDNTIVCKKNNETANLKTDVNLFLRLLSVSRERDVDMQNVLSHKLSAVPLALFYPNGAMRHTAKSNLLNETEIKRYSLPSLMGNSDLGATAIDFMAILQSIDHSKFEGFSNVADEISTKLHSSFCECEVQVVFSDRYDFGCLIKAAERIRPTEDSTHNKKLKLLITVKFQCHFKVTLGNGTTKPIWWNTFSKNGDKH